MSGTTCTLIRIIKIKLELEKFSDNDMVCNSVSPPINEIFSHINHLHFLKEFFTGKIALNHKGKLKMMEKDPFSIDVFACI